MVATTQEAAMPTSCVHPARRGLVLACLAACMLAGCSSSGPPAGGSVRTAVEAKLANLQGRFAAGDYASIPPDIMERLDPSELEQVRRTVGGASVVSFSSEPFSRREDGTFAGHVSFDVSVPIPGAASFLSSRWHTTAIAVVRRDAFSWEATGLLEVHVTRDGGNTERT